MTQNETKQKPIKTNEVKTNSTVLIPVELFYTRFSDLLNGQPLKVSTKNDGAMLAVEVEKVETVAK